MSPPTNRHDVFFEAPASLLGNQSAAYGGFLEFDLRASTPTPGPAFSVSKDVYLLGQGMTLVFHLPYPPGSNYWTRYRLPLTPTGGWHHDTINVHAGAGGEPIVMEFLQVLARLATLRIRAWNDNLAAQVCLDNVRFVTPLVSDVVVLTVRRGNGTTNLLEWPTNAARFHLLETPVLPALEWMPSERMVMATGWLNQVMIPAQAAQHYFRLIRP